MRKIIDFFLVWLGFYVVLAFTAFIVNGFELPFTDCFTLEPVWFIALTFGWIPATIYVKTINLLK